MSAVYPLVIEKLPFSKYCELPGEHSTGLRRALVSPLEYDYYKRNEREDTDTLRIGRAVHTATLEPLQFMREYVLWEGGRRAGKDWDKFEIEHAGKTILKPEQYDPAVVMAEAIRAHPVSGPLFAGAGRNELTIQWRHESGALCKARVDRLSSALIDIKTASDITPHGFASAAMRYGYFTQMAFYHDAVKSAGLGLYRVKIVVVQKKPPHDVVVYDIGDDELAAGREQYERALAIVAECTKTGVWPGQAPVEPVPLRLPAWALPNFEEGALPDFGDEVIQ